MTSDPMTAPALEALLIDRAGPCLAAGLIRAGRLDDLIVLADRGGVGPGDIVAGRVSRVEPALNAAFIDIGTSEHALLRARDLERGPDSTPLPINRRLHQGQMLAVKIVHLGYDDKGPRVIGRLGKTPPGDLVNQAVGAVLHRSDPLAAIIREIRPAEPAEIVVADTLVRLQVSQAWAAAGLDPPEITIDPGNAPLTRFDAQSDIETALGREVPMPGGGRLTFDQTRALLAIDVDSGAGVRVLAAHNLEAACEIARQLRIRNSAGVIIIDFIDSGDPAQRAAIAAALQRAMAPDRANGRLAGFGPLGLCEMTRARRGEPLSSLWPAPQHHGDAR